VRSNVAGEFDEYATTTVVLDRDPNAGPVVPIADLRDRLARVPGVEGAASIWEADTGAEQVSAHLEVPPVVAPVYAVSAGAEDVLEPKMSSGQWLDDYANETGQRVAAVSRSLANDLHLADTSTHPAVFLNGIGFTVIGIYDDVNRSPEVLRGAVVPEVTAINLWNGQPRGTAAIVVATRPGAAPVVAAQASVAARPSDPSSLIVRPVVDPRILRGKVDRQVATLFLSLAAVALLVGVLGAANTTTTGVLQRTAEIGVRRSLGASRAAIMLQFLGESCVVGLVGGVVGVSVGTLAVALMAASWQLSPTMDLRLALAGPGIGLAAGLLAGAYPALRASRVEPVVALRSGQ